MKLHLTFVQRTPRTSASNKPFVSLSIKAEEYGQRYLSGFGRKDNEHWKVGDEVEVGEVKEVVKGDKTYLNFEMPQKETSNSKDLELILTKLTFMSLKMDELVLWKRHQTGEDKPKVMGTEIPYPTAESEGIDMDNLPF